MSTWYNQARLDQSWHTLANAERIKHMLAHADTSPHLWVHMRYTSERAAARDAATTPLPFAIRIAAQVEVSKINVRMLTPTEASGLVHAAEDAFTALAAWPDCAYMLDLPVAVVRTLAGSNNHAAVLLLPAIIAMRGNDDGSDGTSAEGARPEAI